MRVLAWVALWVMLLAASAWYLWRCTRRLMRTARRFAHELADAERLLGRVQQEASARHTAAAADAPAGPAAHEPDDAVQLAVFMGTRQAAMERRVVREALRVQRRARRDATRPGWARRVDSDST